jgi:hypothetical protein
MNPPRQLLRRNGGTIADREEIAWVVGRRHKSHTLSSHAPTDLEMWAKGLTSQGAD